MENDSEGCSSASRLSRRKLLKRSAVMSGAIWVAPAIDSLLTRAAAASALSTPMNVNNYACPANSGTCAATQSYEVTNSPLTVEFTNTSTCGGGQLEVHVNGTLAGTAPCAQPNGGTASVDLGPQTVGATLTFVFVGCSGCTSTGDEIASWQGQVAFS